MRTTQTHGYSPGAEVSVSVFSIVSPGVMPVARRPVEENIMSVSTPSRKTVTARPTPTERPAEQLFQPIRLARYNLPHRMVMAPLTRSRARQPGNVPSALNACYYAQRASAALIASEATQVSQQGQGYAWTPGIHSPEQVEGWRGITDAVHQAGGLIFLQFWHVGRISHPLLAARRHAPRRALGHQASGPSIYRERQGRGRAGPLRDPAGPADRGDALHRPTVPCAGRKMR